MTVPREYKRFSTKERLPMQIPKKCLLFFVFCAFTAICFAQQDKNNLQAVELLSGYARSNLFDQRDKNIIPFYIDFDLNLKPWAQRHSLPFPGLLQFIIEPFVSCVYSSRANAEIGNNFVFKIGLLNENKRFQPFLKFGVGLIYLTYHYKYQATQFNFTEFAGLGAHYFFRKNTALTLEYRYRHISNANLRRPNLGINSNMGLLGISYFF